MVIVPPRFFIEASWWGDEGRGRGTPPLDHAACGVMRDATNSPASWPRWCRAPASVLVAADPGHDALPEGVGADGTGHQVGSVEAERGLGILQDLDRLHEQLARRVLGVDALVRADDAAEAHAVVRPGVARQVGAERLDLLRIAERHDDLAAAGDRQRVIGVRRREQEAEHVAVGGDHVLVAALGVPEGLVERGLVVQRARRRRGSGRPAVWKASVTSVDTSPMPPLTMSSLFRYSPTASNASATCGSLNGMPWVTHWSYTSAPCRRSM